MRYLTTALACEGSTDEPFLTAVIKRSLEEMSRQESESDVEVGEVIILDRRTSDTSALAELLTQDAALYDIVFLHRDSKRSEQWYASLQKHSPPGLLVRLVPVQETEAWLLADDEALRAVTGIRDLTRVQLGLSSDNRSVERLSDPKAMIASLNLNWRLDYSSLGEIARLETLRQVPAFNDWYQATRQALRDLRVL